MVKSGRARWAERLCFCCAARVLESRDLPLGSDLVRGACANMEGAFAPASGTRCSFDLSPSASLSPDALHGGLGYIFYCFLSLSCRASVKGESRSHSFCGALPLPCAVESLMPARVIVSYCFVAFFFSFRVRIEITRLPASRLPFDIVMRVAFWLFSYIVYRFSAEIGRSRIRSRKAFL